MTKVRISLDRITQFVSKKDIATLVPLMERCNRTVHKGDGRGSDFLGWVNLPSSIGKKQIADITECADALRAISEVVIVIGIGGSYLGAKAVMEALTPSFAAFDSRKGQPLVLFAGHNISEDYMAELLAFIKERSFSLIVISKSGTTTEPAIAFRLLREELEKRYGRREAASRIVAVTDSSRGALRTLCDKEGYKSYVIPDNVGGRFSVLTPVGLLPLAVAGIDIARLVKGAAAMEKATAEEVSFEENPAMQYAAARYALYTKLGKKVELLVSFEPKLQYFAEWWKQLYGESEGKEGKGIMPHSAVFTTDLHSMGQYIQQGERIMFETVISVGKPSGRVVIKSDKANLDGLNFLAGKRLCEVNRMAELGTMLAHVDGGVPNIAIEIDTINAETVGMLLYMFEKAVAISGYAIDINPFDQPGVEEYKRNMFALLNKPGYEEEGEKLKKRISAGGA
ncbi:MAG: glucose-6-phosphate isomerase [Rikenellaceae bacterium]|nr:glucose-6-phosphate isomerase [Rikenellaceae bacterium]